MTNNSYQKKEARQRHQDLTEEKQDKKRQYACEGYRNLSENKKKENKHQYVCEQCQNLLEDQRRNFFLEYRK